MQTHLNVQPVMMLCVKRMGVRVVVSGEQVPLCDTPSEVSWLIVKEPNFPEAWQIN